jgi:uncharacterized protein with PIN domain
MKPEEQRLTREQVGGIVKMLGLTRDREFNCSECLQHVSEFAECQMVNKPVGEVIASVEQHLALCPECREEYEALMKILKAGQRVQGG